MRIAIIGAGISGLTTAFYLARARPEWQLSIFDAATTAGGTMQTRTVEGFRFEAGGNGFLGNKPDSFRLVEDCGAQHLLLPSSDLARRRFIFNGSLHPLPESPPAFLKSRLISLPQKLRVAGELLVPPRRNGPEETLQQFGYRRVGKGLTDVFLDAMTAGIYATTPDRVSVRAAFPLVVELEQQHGGLIRGMLARRKKGAGPGGILMSFKGGVASLIEHLRSVITADWQLGQPVLGLGRDGGGWRLQTAATGHHFDKVIVATQAHAAARLFEQEDAELARLLRRIEYSPITVVGFGYRDLQHPLQGFGLLTTTSSRQPVLGILWDSSIFPDRAPQGCKSLRVMIGGQRNPELAAQDDEGLLRSAREGLAATMGVTQDADVVFIQRWPKGIPSYVVGHLARADAIFRHVGQQPGLHLVGNAYYGIAMNDCVRNGRELAARLAEEG